MSTRRKDEVLAFAHRLSTMKSPKNTTAEFLEFSRRIIIDTREQNPFQFTGIRADARDGRKEIIVTTKRGKLDSGDYSLEGFERTVAIERKSAPDLFSTLGRGRSRFERELSRLSGYDFAAVVVESDWAEILSRPPERSELNPLCVYRSVIAWQQRHPRVHWWFCPDREFAQRTTFRILQRYLIDHGESNAAFRRVNGSRKSGEVHKEVTATP